MARKTSAQLLAAAQVIIDQTTVGGNTKELVGGLLQDMIDSLSNLNTNVDQGVVATAGATLTLDMNSLAERIFKGDATITGPKTLALSNSGNALNIPSFIFTLSGLHALTLPSNFKMSDARWNSGTKVWTPLDAGQYNAKAVFDGTSWLLTIDQNSGPFS
jgi:hypothetical protein